MIQQRRVYRTGQCFWEVPLHSVSLGIIRIAGSIVRGWLWIKHPVGWSVSQWDFFTIWGCPVCHCGTYYPSKFITVIGRPTGLVVHHGYMRVSPGHNSRKWTQLDNHSAELMLGLALNHSLGLRAARGWTVVIRGEVPITHQKSFMWFFEREYFNTTTDEDQSYWFVWLKDIVSNIMR